jgi:flagellin
LLDGSFSAEFQVGADANQTISMTMTSIAAATGGTVSVDSFTVSGLSSIGSSSVVGSSFSYSADFIATAISVSSQSNAQKILAGMDSLIAVVDKKRAELGAVQNRFQSTIRNQSNIAENLSAAKSRIKDTDFAQETANLTKMQILQQASQTILSQANQRPQAALSLLG